MDTTSNALSRTLYLLSIHQDAQRRLRQEVLEAMKYGDLAYDRLEALRYLDAVCRETMRLYVFDVWDEDGQSDAFKHSNPPVTNMFRE